MTTKLTTRSLLAATLILPAACDTETPTSVVVDNAFPAVGDSSVDAEVMTVYQVWWRTTLLENPVAPGAESERERTVPGSDYAYVLVAPAWDSASGRGPTRLLALRSAAALSVARGDTLHIAVGPAGFVGNCAAGTALTADDADLITTRIFPGAFSGVHYDPATCTTTPVVSSP